MGRRKTKQRARLGFTREYIDCTPERLAKGDASEFINPAIIDSSEQPIGHTRRFHKLSKLDRWHKAGVITQRQFAAGNEYRTLHAFKDQLPRVVASYGERTTGGECDYGLARTQAQARARQRWRAARDNIPSTLLGIADRLLIHDSLPAYRGRAQMNMLTDVRNALDALAHHFERPC